MLTTTRCKSGTSHWVDFKLEQSGITFADILEEFGELPILLILTVKQKKRIKKHIKQFTQNKGSVAAPSGTTFYATVFEALANKNRMRN